ncbi:hypothetical protein BIU88_12610 [Chlorobaculum limnaeum]|uniref:Lipoprotein n=1 Tax=Chlorobaculum limnaeum TaxID=274537 RepID=A0A1D8D143_CHLLM|nr:DUF799 domain-containing protein [Chlorobaculum limnaeum]AOS84896.1 hypothetical protein BIU88_12610 [Chlorobaculum limnaeum]
MKFFKSVLTLSVLSLLGGCAGTVAKQDYTNYRNSKPASILVLPPVNHSPDIKATYGFLSTATKPLAEGGYYVFPVALVDQTFKENGLQNPAEMHDAPLNKLREIFGADAVLYITIESYGASYKVVSSDTVVTADARLIDAKTGALLWSGNATASSAESDNNSNLGLAGLLVKAIVKQVVSSAVDQGHDISKITSSRLLSPRPNGLLYGPRSPMYQSEK